MPEIKPSFVTVKKWIKEAAVELGSRMSERQAKSLAGDFLNAGSDDDYKRIVYSDPVGEGVAKRWANFKHNLEGAAA